MIRDILNDPGWSLPWLGYYIYLIFMCIIGIARAENMLEKIIDQWKHIELKSNSNDQPGPST